MSAHRAPRLLLDTAPLLSRYRIDKLTFAGGEPTLVPFLPELLHETRQVGLVSTLVTNGSTLTSEFLAKAAPSPDWVALSIESPSERTNAELGRGFGSHVRTTRAAVDRLRDQGCIRLKLNTVVTSLNWQEDLHELVTWVRPERWKVFQATRIEDQNGTTIGNYAVSGEQFAEFCARHADLDPVCESSDAIRGSYLMIDPRGRFFGNAQGHHVYSDPIAKVGIEEAVRQVGWSPLAFLARGGSYLWRTSDSEVAS